MGIDSGANPWCSQGMGRLFVLVLFLSAGAFGVETGRVAGRVFDKRSLEPLALANVTVVGIQAGGASDRNGYYAIVNLLPGVYTVEASMVGYRPVRVTEVLIEPDKITRVDFWLEPMEIEMPGVVVRAERPIVSKELVAPRYAFNPKEQPYLPGDGLMQLALMAPGVAKGESTLHIRGGRAQEVDYRIDGVSVIDPIDGELGMELARGVADEVIFLPGGFSVEYGRAMSGVVDIFTTNPKPDFGAGYRVKSERMMPWYYDFGFNEQELSFQLPFLPGLRFFSSVSAMTVADWDPRLFFLPHKGRASYCFFGKLLYERSARFRASLSLVRFRTQFDRYHHQWALILDDYRSDWRKSGLLVGKLTYMPAERFFSTLTVSYFGTKKRSGVRVAEPLRLERDITFRDTGEYVAPQMDMNNPWGCPFESYWYFYTRGSYEEFRDQGVRDIGLKLVSHHQVASRHQLVAGINLDRYQVQTDWLRWPAWQPVLDSYRFQPSLLGFYLQDKVDYEGLYADIGLRYDRFDPDTTGAKGQFSPRLGASFRITDWLFMRANYGHYFQLPLFCQLYDNTVNPVKYRTVYGEQLLVVGNPDLGPEKTVAYELGLQGEVGKDIGLSVNLWRKDVYGLIGTREVPELPQRYVTYFNVDYAKLTGLEMVVDWREDWFASRLGYNLSWSRGTSSYANQAYDEFIRAGDTAPLVEYYLDFDQRNRLFAQIDLNLSERQTGSEMLNTIFDSLGVHLLGYLGNGFPYSPPGGKGDPQTWNTRLKPWRSSLDAVINRRFRLGRLGLNVIVEVLNVLNIREIMDIYPNTGKPNDDGVRIGFDQFYRPELQRVRFGDRDYHPARDDNHDGYITQYEDYRSAVLYHQASIDWVNNYGPPRRARLCLQLDW
ncbi:MAG: TonB-dependent receptor [bacterium]